MSVGERVHIRKLEMPAEKREVSRRILEHVDKAEEICANYALFAADHRFL